MSTISSSFVEQYERTWRMLEAIVKRFPADKWKAGDRPELVPAKWALHLVTTVDFYCRPVLEGFDRTFLKRHEGDISALPDQEALLAYATEVAGRARAWFDSLSDEDMMRPGAFAWAGTSVLDQSVYQLRHTMFHLGELSFILRTLGAEETEWE